MKKATLAIPLLLAACATAPAPTAHQGFGRVGDRMETLHPIATPAPQEEALAEILPNPAPVANLAQ